MSRVHDKQIICDDSNNPPSMAEERLIIHVNLQMDYQAPQGNFYILRLPIDFKRLEEGSLTYIPVLRPDKGTGGWVEPNPLANLESGLTKQEQEMLCDAVSSMVGVHSRSEDEDGWINLRHRLDEIFGGVALEGRISDALAVRMGDVLTPDVRKEVVKTIRDFLEG